MNPRSGGASPLDKIVFIFAVTIFFCACPTQKEVVAPQPVLVSDAGHDPREDADASLSPDPESEDGAILDNCAKACINLRKPTVHCKTGSSVTGAESCAVSCRHARDTRLMPLDIPCAEKARNPDEAHKCKGWGC